MQEWASSDFQPGVHDPWNYHGENGRHRVSFLDTAAVHNDARFGIEGSSTDHDWFFAEGAAQTGPTAMWTDAPAPGR
jgi:hypothetical protein